LRGFDRWVIRTVPRAENARADELVNQALDAAS
jgi:ribonuclease HI